MVIKGNKGYGGEGVSDEGKGMNKIYKWSNNIKKYMLFILVLLSSVGRAFGC